MANTLAPQHRADLEKSGLTAETIEAGGFKSVPPGSITKRLGFNYPGLESCYEIPYPGCNGFARYRAFYAEGQRGPKYLQRKGSGNHLYIPPTSRAYLADVAIPCYLTEGEKKAAKAAQEGLACVGLGGLWNWSDGRGGLLADFDQIPLQGRSVFIVPDSDYKTPKAHRYGKKAGNLEEAVRRLAEKLAERGAKVGIVQLPQGPLKGLDDFLCKHSVEDFKALPVITPRRSSSKQDSSHEMKLTHLRDLLEEPEEEVTWVVDGILPGGGFSIVAAKPKVGKSTLARAASYAVSKGLPFIGRHTMKGPVIYVALEDKRREVRRHFEDMGVTGEEDIYVYAARAPEGALEKLKKQIEDIRPVLVVIDPLFRFTRMKDEKAYAEVTNKLEPLLALARETGAHVMVTHHATKGDREGGDALLGSTAIFGSVDTAIILKRFPKYRTIATIQRYGEDLEETTLTFDPDRRTIDIGDTREEEEVRSFGDMILAVLEARQEPLTEAETLEGIEGRLALKRRALQLLVNAGTVIRSGRGRKGDPFRFVHFRFSHIYTGNREMNLESESSPSDNGGNSFPENTPTPDLFREMNFPQERQKRETPLTLKGMQAEMEKASKVLGIPVFEEVVST